MTELPQRARHDPATKEALMISLSVVQSLIDPKPAESVIHVYARAVEAERKIRTVLSAD